LRPEFATHNSRRGRLGAGALMIGVPASVAAVVMAGQALAAPAPAQPVPAPAPAAPQIQPQSRQITYGHEVVVRGFASPADAGDTVVLEFAPRGENVWSQLGSTTVGATGAFRLASRLERSGTVQVVDTSSGSLTPFLASGNGGASAATSNRVSVDVAARLRVPSHGIAILAGQALQVRGRLLTAARSPSRRCKAGPGTRLRLPAPARPAGSPCATSPAAPAGRRSASASQETGGTAGRRPWPVR